MAGQHQNSRFHRGDLLLEVLAPKMDHRLIGRATGYFGNLLIEQPGFAGEFREAKGGLGRLPRRLSVVGVDEVLVVLADFQNQFHIALGNRIHVFPGTGRRASDEPGSDADYDGQPSHGGSAYN